MRFFQRQIANFVNLFLLIVSWNSLFIFNDPLPNFAIFFCDRLRKLIFCERQFVEIYDWLMKFCICFRDRLQTFVIYFHGWLTKFLILCIIISLNSRFFYDIRDFLFWIVKLNLEFFVHSFDEIFDDFSMIKWLKMPFVSATFHKILDVFRRLFEETRDFLHDELIKFIIFFSFNWQN